MLEKTGKTLYKFLVLITENILHWFWRWQFKSIALVSSSTGVEIFKIQKQPLNFFLKISRNSQENTYVRVFDLDSCRSQACNFIKKTLQHRDFCELCEIFKSTFYTSDCFPKYESLHMTAAVHSYVIKSCSENVWKKSRSISPSDCNF